MRVLEFVPSPINKARLDLARRVIKGKSLALFHSGKNKGFYFNTSLIAETFYSLPFMGRVWGGVFFRDLD